MRRLALLLATACAAPPPPAPAPDVAPFVAQLGWTFAALPDAAPALPAPAAQAAAIEEERRLDAAVVDAARARGEAGAALYAAFCQPDPSLPDEALARLADADDALRWLAVQATVAAVRAAPPGREKLDVVLQGPLGQFVGEHRRAAMPPFERLPALPGEAKAQIGAAERTRADALDAAIGAWRQAVAGWDATATDADATLRAATDALRPALDANQRARAEDALALLRAVAPEDRPRVLLSRGFRAFLGAAPVSEMWGFLLHRGGGGAAPGRGVGPPGQVGPGPGNALPPGTFAPGTGDPNAFPSGTGDPSQLPAVPPADVPLSPDGVPPPPENNPTPGPIEGPAPPSVEPPPDGAMQPPPPPAEDQGPPPPEPPPPDVNAGQPTPGEDGFNGVRPR